MNKKSLLPALSFFLIFGTAFYSLNLTRASAASFVGGKTLILYDADSRAIPSAPLLGFTDFPPGVALPTYSNGVTVLNTTVSGNETYAGWVSNGATALGFPILDRTAGFQVNFSIQVESESHTNNHRAGFSMIILSEDARGIELGFWQNEIWAQSDDMTGGLFKHGEGVAFATAAGLIDYQVTIVGDTYTLTANTNPILTGLVRDYSLFDGFPDPYETPNFLFLGDDTTSAQARVQLRFVSITGTEPATPTNINTSTSSPMPTASPTSLPTGTPMPSPTPVGKAVEFCPSSWLLAAMVITIMIKKIGRVF